MLWHVGSIAMIKGSLAVETCLSNVYKNLGSPTLRLFKDLKFHRVVILCGLVLLFSPPPPLIVLFYFNFYNFFPKNFYVV